MHRNTVRVPALASRHPRRLMLALACVLALSGCDQRPPEVATGPASAGSNSAAPGPLHFSTDSPGVGTQIGARSLGAGTTTTGKAGFLLFGPYVALPAGSYQAAVQGAVLAGHAGNVYVDVAVEKGARVITAVELDPTALAVARSPDGMVVLPFTLDAAVADLEVRVRVTPQSQLAVSAIDILPVR